MEDEDIVREIRGIEDAADRLIQEAHEKVKELELTAKREIKEIEFESEKGFEVRSGILKSTLNEDKKREESVLIARFDEERKRLEAIDKETLKRLTDMITEKISEG